MLGSQGLQHGIETLPRPPQQLAQPMDGDAVLGVVDAVVGGVELLP